MAESSLRSRARDVTTEVASTSALVIAPHPDDETLGCGATILHKVMAGSRVTVLLVTDGRNSHAGIDPAVQAKLRRSEMAEAGRRLGLPDTALIWGDFEDGAVTAEEPRLDRLLEELIHGLAPDEVYATCTAEPHPDHAAVGRSARLACANAGIPLFEYPIWLWSAWPLRSGDRVGSTVDFMKRRVVSVSLAGLQAKKRHALEAHASQLTRPSMAQGEGNWDTLPPAILRNALSRPELFLR